MSDSLPPRGSLRISRNAALRRAESGLGPRLLAQLVEGRTQEERNAHALHFGAAALDVLGDAAPVEPGVLGITWIEADVDHDGLNQLGALARACPCSLHFLQGL